MMEIHRSVRAFHARSPLTAAAVAFTAANAMPVPKPSFQYHAIRSRWYCPPTWLQTVKVAMRASRNSIAKKRRSTLLGYPETDARAATFRDGRRQVVRRSPAVFQHLHTYLRGRAAGIDRPEWLGQIDAAEDHGRHAGTGHGHADGAQADAHRLRATGAGVRGRYDRGQGAGRGAPGAWDGWDG